MYVRLNLATNPLLSHRRFLAGSAVVGVLGLLLFLGLGWRAYNLRKAEEDLRARSSKIQKEMAAVERERKELEIYFAQQEAAGFQDHAKFVVGVLQARSINWTQMFMDLERTLPPGVRIVHIQPKLEKGIVSVHFVVGATNQEAKLKLLKSFENSSSFSHVTLLSDRASTQQGSDPLTIEFVAEYPNT
jgi:Tfp pilus assembly protein PilN